METAFLPSQLLTQNSVGSAVLDDAGNYVGVPDYQTKLAELWKVS